MPQLTGPTAPEASKASPALKAKRGRPSDREYAGKQAQRQAAAILEVLAGARTPAQAAEDLGVSLPRYYILEQRAVNGLLAACQPRRPGYSATPESQLARLRKEVKRWQRESARQQALVRSAQRVIGLAEPAARPATGRRCRRPMVRALRHAARLKSDDHSQEDGVTTEVSGAGRNAEGTAAP
jgi:hypothetical protein